jgi:hypothetical protein
MTEQDKQPEDAEITDESAVPLPERNAMSILTGPLAPVDGGIAPDPTPPTTADKVPPPGYRT